MGVCCAKPDADVSSEFMTAEQPKINANPHKAAEPTAVAPKLAEPQAAAAAAAEEPKADKSVVQKTEEPAAELAKVEEPPAAAAAAEEPKAVESVVQKTEEPAAEMPKVASKPNFSGTWALTKADGDWDKFLTDQGAGYAKRAMFKSMGLGVGKLSEEIKQETREDKIHITIVTKSSQGGAQNAFLVDGQEQDGIDQGAPCLIAPRWEDDQLVAQLFEKKNHKIKVTLYRSMVDESNMCLVMESAKGNKVQRHFSKQ